MKTSLFSAINKIHLPLVGLICVIAMLSVMMLYSAAGGNMQPWATAQIIRFALGFCIMMTMVVTPTKLLLQLAYPFYFLCIILLLVVEVSGHIGMGAQRWIDLGFLNLQPSELTKVAIIMALARYFHHAHPDIISSPKFLLIPILLIALPTILILNQPNLGTATILAVIGVIILFSAGVRWRYFIGSAILIAISTPIAWHFLHDYQKRRVLTFLDPEKDPLGAGYNIIQSVIAIGSGGLFGKGFLNGSQGQLDFLPEKETDFIFTMLAEEFGFAGCSFLLLLYILIIIFGYKIAFAAKNRFGYFIAIGMSSMLFLHLFINIGMNMGILPVVGVPLPLFSYGGSMMIAIMMGFGLMINIWANREKTL